MTAREPRPEASARGAARRIRDHATTGGRASSGTRLKATGQAHVHRRALRFCGNSCRKFPEAGAFVAPSFVFMEGWARTRTDAREGIETSPNSSNQPRRLTAVDLFCGAGGLSYAFHEAGFFIVAAVEKDPETAATYERSFRQTYSPDTQLLVKSVGSAAVRRVLEKLRLTTPIDLVLGGPPCQDFSPARLRKPRNGQRSSLVRQYFKLLSVVQPRAFLFENVPGLRTAKSGKYWEELVEEAERIGYEVSHAELEASRFGVPQRRKRLFVVGVRANLGLFVFPEGGSAKPPTVWQTIGHLQPLEAGELDPEDPMHRARCHRPDFVAYLKHIKEGQDWRDVRHVRVLPCHEEHNGHYDVYGRMRRDDISPTITGGCTNPSKGRFVHPTCHRGLTVREAALLQTFPSTWQFEGGVDSRAQQVGNAVPVKLGAALAHALREKLVTAISSSSSPSQGD